MDPDVPNWKLIDEASRHLTTVGRTPFSRMDVYRLIWRDHPERQRPSLDPTFQGMVSNASGGPASAGGTPLRRVERGLYERHPRLAADRSRVDSVPTRSSGGPTAIVPAPLDQSPSASVSASAVAAGPLSTGGTRDTPRGLDWLLVWRQAGRRLAQHADAGPGHLLTEDTLRFAVALEIEAQGLPASAIRVEWPDPLLGQAARSTWSWTLVSMSVP